MFQLKEQNGFSSLLPVVRRVLAKWKALFGSSAAVFSAKVAMVPPVVPERSSIASDADQQKLKPGDVGYRCEFLRIVWYYVHFREQMCLSWPQIFCSCCVVVARLVTRLQVQRHPHVGNSHRLRASANVRREKIYSKRQRQRPARGHQKHHIQEIKKMTLRP
jgi:hypothetical protein